MAEAREGSRLGLPFGVSALLHAAAAVLLFVMTRDAARMPVTAPMYKVDIVAAPPGPRAAGVVTPPPAVPEPVPETPPAPPPPRAQQQPSRMPAPPTTQPVPPRRRPPAQATPTPVPTPPAPNVPPQRAGGGPTGGRGTDVATVRTEGIDFPYPGYLNNIVRQIALNFRPRNPNAPLRAEVAFLIHRDGSVTDLRFITRSGNYAFDLESQGAVEAAAGQGSFGPLPDGFSDDVLPVIFSFDPRVLR